MSGYREAGDVPDKHAPGRGNRNMANIVILREPLWATLIIRTHVPRGPVIGGQGG